MLDKMPKSLGRALDGVHADAADLAVAHTELTGKHATIEITSPAFSYNEIMPSKYTADGEGLSPPLKWDGVPENAVSLVLLVEDPDSPTPKPLVHAIAWNLPAQDGSIGEGALGDDNHESRVPTGKNSYLSDQYLPPDPPPGHGRHRYVFQIFALDTRLNFEKPPGRSALLDAIRGHVLAKGLHIGIYERA
ncbi:MAG: YbhB/YbcL family Raf kinase inhibitor-like protein [Povalibacter sp.]